MYSRLNNETRLSDETSPGGNKTETSDISTSPIPVTYGSTPAQDKPVHRFYVPFCGLVFYVMAFFGYFCSFALRESLSVAIVAMVNQTTITEADIAMINASDQVEECPRDPELEREGGELNWDRNQEAIVLSAFYYGYVVTQVYARSKFNHLPIVLLFQMSFDKLQCLFQHVSLDLGLHEMCNIINLMCILPRGLYHGQRSKSYARYVCVYLSQVGALLKWLNVG